MRLGLPVLELLRCRAAADRPVRNRQPHPGIRRTVEALLHRLHHLLRDRAPEARDPGLRHRVVVDDGPDRGPVAHPDVGPAAVGDWNLAGRAGRIGHDSVGVVGLSEGKDRDALIEFVSRSTGALVSRLVVLLDELAAQGSLAPLSDVLWTDQWEDFRCYIAHLWAEKRNLDAVLADSEQLLRQTYGYTLMRNDPAQRQKADALLDATQSYARKLAAMPEGISELADSNGFSPEGVQAAMGGIGGLETRLTVSDWAPESLFGKGGRMADLFGVMLRVP